MAPILIIDDEPDLIDMVSFNLAQEGFEVLSDKDGAAGLATACRVHPVLIILDLMLPSMDGLEICRRLRSDVRTQAVPVLMLTAKGSETDRVVGLEIGADDYVTKPFSTRELVARIRAILRRSPGAAQPPKRLQFGQLMIDAGRYQARYDGHNLPLTVAEFEILRFLAGHPEQVFTRLDIIENALGRDVVVTDRNIDVHVGAIRKKLGAGKRHIETVRGVGYRFSPTLQPAL